MMKLPKRYVDRARANLRKYQRILQSARTRDVNESDTVVIVNDFLCDVLGYDKYEDITTEFSIRSTFCDLAVKRDGRVQFLIEVKSIGTDLRETHMRQALDYGANQGIEFILLTNGISWQAYRIRFEQPISYDEVFAVDLMAADAKPQQLLERLYLISKEAGGQTEIDEFHRRREATSRFVVGQLLLAQPTLAVLRRQLRACFPGIRVTEADLEELLRAEVLKRDVLEGERVTGAQKMLRKAGRKRAPRKTAVAIPVDAPVPSTVADVQQKESMEVTA